MKYIFTGNALMALVMVATAIINTPLVFAAMFVFLATYVVIMIPVGLRQMREDPVNFQLAKAIRY